MIELKCKNCGGKLSVKDDLVFRGDSAVIVRRGSSLRCEHCGAEYSQGDELNLAGAKIQVQQNIGKVEGGVVIGIKL